MNDDGHGGDGIVDPLDAVATERTLRDVLREVPVDAAVPPGWRVGTEVVQFGGALPADGVTLRHSDRPRELLITAAGADGGDALAVYERDRTVGRRTAVAGVPAGGTDRETLRDALDAAARATVRVERGEAAGPAGDPAERAAVTVGLRARVRGALRTLRGR